MKGLQAAILAGMVLCGATAGRAADVPIDILGQQFGAALARLSGGRPPDPQFCAAPGSCYQDVGSGVALLTQAPGGSDPVETATLLRSADDRQGEARFDAASAALVAMLSPHVDAAARAALVRGLASDFRRAGAGRAARDNVVYELTSDADRHVIFRATTTTRSP